MKKKSVIAIVICALLCTAFSIVAFAGDYDTPTIPICTNHRYIDTVIKAPTCTESGTMKRVCRSCSKTITEPIDPIGHQFSYNNNQTADGVELKCKDCDTTETISAEALEKKWDMAYVNAAPARTVDEASDSAYLDLNADGIINAKDYALIVHLRHQELKLNSQNGSSLIGTETEEELP